ncbi:inositol 2-dehydrogenase [Parapedobacter indicus]|uniref:Myo-inositol 2-dehydrogenase n=1 Tax=Parapedobacter indicus TaxID=1477437 RepID=A0A1I3PXC1_9SPHI|nr:inositol 2-dehydrogenase [Parapedobacter indicus]PPL00604.1 myo-inositol 2-dehydrogenase [Parapedobacter indicus]SFJ26308.1 myo-inositol 2-dehydrogenase [Parapedobacter indicus]
MQLKIGIIGLGRIGTIHYNNITQQITEAEVVMVADVRNDALPAHVQFAQADQVINHPEIEAVVICSPTDTHADYVEQCARAGKHVFCEKPLDLSLTRIQQTLAVVQQQGIKLMLGFNRRFDANFMKLRSLVGEGKIGDVHVVKITSRDPAPPSLTYLQHSGGLFMDMSIHDFDMARYIMNKEVVQVYAAAATLTGGVVAAAGDIDTAVVTLTFEDGSMAVIDNSRQAAYGYDQRLEVFGSKGMALVDNNKPDNHVYYHAHGAQSSLPLHFFMERYTASYLTEMQAFVKAVKGGHELPVSGEDGLKAARIAVAAQQSVRMGGPITLGEVIV